MADGISFRMELDSADAERALERLQGASEGLGRSLERIASALEGGGFGVIEKTVLAAAAAVVGLTAGLFSMAKAASETVDSMGEMATQTGTTIAQMSAFKGALVAFEANGATVQRAFERMGNTIQEVFPKMQKEIEDFASKSNKDLLSVATATLSVEDAQAKLARLERTQASQRAALTGGPLPPFRDWRVVRQEALDAMDRDMRRAQLAVEQALQAQEEAQAKAEETAKNSIGRLAKYVDALASGLSTAGINVNVTVENMIKGLVASVGPGVQALEAVGSSFRDIAKKAPELHPVMLKLADAFKNMEDKTLRMAIATKLFGRKDARDMVESLSEGSAALLAEEERVTRLGLVFNDADDKISKGFIKSMNRLGFAIEIVAAQFGLLFQPGFTEVLNTIAASLENNRTAILGWGASIRDTVMPIIQGFVRALLGIPQAGTDDWAVRLVNGAKAVGTAISTVFFGLVVPAFKGLLTVAEAVAAGINRIFGTAFSAIELLAIGVFARIALAFGAMLVGSGPVGLAIITIGLALGLLITYLPQLKTVASEAWGAFTAKVREATEWVNRVFGTNFTANAAAVAGAIGLVTLAFIALRAAVTVVGGLFALMGAGFTALAASGPVLLAVLAAIAVALIAFNWDKIKEGAGKAFDAVVVAAKQMILAVAGAVGKIIESIGSGLAEIPAAIGNAVSAIVTSIGAAFGQIATAIGTAISGVITSIATAIAGIATTIGTAISNIISAVGTALESVGTAIGTSFGAGLSSSIVAAINTGLLTAVAGIGTALQAVPWGAFEGAGMSAMSIVNSATNILIGTIQRLTTEIEKAAQAFGQLQGKAAGGVAGPSGGHASGGLLGGRGTGTSDSNLAWVSRGEYITPARAVSQPGVLAFLEALRRSGGNLRDVLDGMGHFVRGGLIRGPLAIPAFAGGGMNTVTINFPGLPEITGLRASSAVVDELRKAAAMAQVRSGGRKPSRYS